MLYFSLVVSGVLLLAVNVIVARTSWPLFGTVAVCVVALICPFGLFLFFPAVALQSALLVGSLLILLWKPRGKRLYIPLSCVVTLAAYGGILFDAKQKHDEYARLREQFPFESIESRLPLRPPTEVVPLAHADHLSQLENDIDMQSSNKKYELQHLHERSVDTFVNSPGFGVGRMMIFDPSAESLTKDLQSTTAVPQPDYHKPFTPPSGPLSVKPSQWNEPNMGRLHDSSVLDFVNARNFGFVKDRQHVAGFQRHGMTKVPAADASVWSVARVDLVGLVIHETPVAYVSANLPRMDELKEAPKRPLDDFELEALESLKKGEDLIARGTDEKARMLGAIRATKQCIACHGGSRGDLLGAFSYGLRRESK